MSVPIRVSALCLGAVLFLSRAGAQVLPPALSSDEATEVRSLLAAMKADERGPYSRIRWYCADGSVHPPQGTPCRELGGGVQHAELGESARRLARLHFHVGTILQGVTVDELLDAAYANHWLKELVLAQYLYEVDDGWVLRRARYYRGARQIEDEEAKGREILVQLLSAPEWTRQNFLLAFRLTGVIPHLGVGGDPESRRIRNLATEIADLDPAFLRTRIKIHSVPSREDLAAVEAFLRREDLPGAVREKLVTLRQALARQYDPLGGLESFQAFEGSLGPEVTSAIRSIRVALEAGAEREALGRMASLSATLRERIQGSSDGRANLVRMDLNRTLQARASLLAQGLRPESRVRENRLVRVRWVGCYIDLTFGAGFLSGREREALKREIGLLTGANQLPALEYRSGLRYLARGIDWSWGRVRSVFGPMHLRYLGVEPRAEGFLDAEVRGSILLALSDELTFLAADADALLGASHRILGEAVSGGIRGLNPGLARGPLDFLEPGMDEVEADRVYVLPVTLPELKPVAGVLTLEEGNLLSHVQLLARNLGIPNASLSPGFEHRLRNLRGREVVYAVSPLGRVVLSATEGLDPELAPLLEGREAAPQERVRLDLSRLRLDRTRPLPLSELRADLSGVFVGPKAANLGQLASYFPEQVAAGVALPFGMFLRHVDRPFDSSGSVLEELRAAYREGDRMRSAGASEAEIDALMFRSLERSRRAIVELEWIPEIREEVVEAVAETFGSGVSRGVFVRSDTNVEDLPQFSGAGLNLTVPHRTSLDAILAAVKQVWTSPFTERAYLWRKQILEDQGNVYPSVLLLASVPSEKSGVLITTGLEAGNAGSLTVVTAEGVGGGVEGEEAETLVVEPSGTVHLLSQAKSPRRRALTDRQGGGVEWLAASNPDTLLQSAELDQLLRAANQWKTRFAPGDPQAVWDMEFGFVNGKLWLFQVRPFIRARSEALLERLRVLDRDLLGRGEGLVSLLEPI